MRYNLSVTNRLRRIAMKYNARVLSPSYNENGWPDRLIVAPGGVTIWIEIKSKRDRIRGEQRYILDWLASNGHKTFVIKQGEEKEIFDRIENVLAGNEIQA